LIDKECNNLDLEKCTLIHPNMSKPNSKYDSFVPNKTQIKFAKFVLGVHKSATNIAVLSELGLFHLSLCTIKATINYWLHLLSANANSF
jgi:hypothetical protein